MPHCEFEEINIVDDNIDDMTIIKNIINAEKLEDAFYVADISDVIKRHNEWISKMPKVIPHYAIKCNSNPTVIKVLAALNACFDCASKQEIAQVIQYGVQGKRIIFAHPMKLPSHIEYSKKVGVEQMTVDSELELLKIKNYFPKAKIVIRIRCDAKNSPVSLGVKFGCKLCEAECLIQRTKDLGLYLHGFSFHVGTPCLEINAYRRGIRMCERLIAYAKSIGCKSVQLIDIGGGFECVNGKEFNELAQVINDAIKNLDSGIKVISEPGRYYVGSNFTLATYLHSKKLVISKNGMPKRMYYVNCGVYNGFLDELLGLQMRVPEVLFEPLSEKKFPSSLWGPTADSLDLIAEDALLPELYIGDWLVWKNMGAYTLALSNTFNGFPIPVVKPFIRKSQWKNFLKQLNET